MLGQRNASRERRVVRERSREGRRNISNTHSHSAGGVMEVAINEEADPNLFTFGPDGRIYQKGEMNDTRSMTTASLSHGRGERTRSYAPPRPQRLPSTGIVATRRGSHGEINHPFSGDFDLQYEEDLSLAIQLSLSTLAPVDEAPLRPLSRAREMVPPPPDMTVDESANPNLFYIGSDGRICRKVNRNDHSHSFEEESRRNGVTWLHDPNERRLTPPPPPPRRISRRSPADSSPATVVWQNDDELGREPLTQLSRRTVPRRLKKSSSLPVPPPRPTLLAPFCLHDSARKALQDLLASRRAAIVTSHPSSRFDPNHMTYENLLLLDSAPLSATERAKKGLSVEKLRTIHSVLIQTNLSTSPQCSICQEDFHQNEPALCLPHCQHVFHGECLGPWLTDHSICPNCRRSVV
jgi:hypothetical protein